MYSARVVKILIASPSDVQEERLVIREAIYKWNTFYSEEKNIILQPIMWETHSAALMGNSPQNIINEQMVLKCDMAIGVFWTRIGTETEVAESGTVEEIKRIGGSGKIVMLFLSDKPIEPSKIDIEQYNKLKEFKKQSYEKGLIEHFHSSSELESKLQKALIININNNKDFTEQIGISKSEPTQREPTLELIDSFPKDNEEISIDDIKNIFLKFNKPINKNSLKYIVNYFVRRNMITQWDICGWIQLEEDDTKIIWHVKEDLLCTDGWFEPPKDVTDYHMFEIQIGREPDKWKVTGMDGSFLPQQIIRVKIKQNE